MKILIILIMCLSQTVHANSRKLTCTQKSIKEAMTTAKKHSGYDKNMHCSTSCMLTLKCTSPVTALIGVGKEFKDLIGKGNAEVADLKANNTGISIAKSKRAKNSLECLEQCDLYY